MKKPRAINLNDHGDVEAAYDRKPKSEGFFHLKYFQVTDLDKLIYHVGKSVRPPPKKCTFRIQFEVQLFKEASAGPVPNLLTNANLLIS
jgi:hypothetical protein